MPKFDLSSFGEKVLQSLKRQTEGSESTVYEDLAGNVYDAKAYHDRLDSDEEFALRQIDLAVRTLHGPERAADGATLTPLQQRRTARSAAEYIRKGTAPFQAIRRALSEEAIDELAPDDLNRIIRSLDIEHGIRLNEVQKGLIAKKKAVSKSKKKLGFAGKGLMKRKGLTTLKERLAQQRPRFKKTS